MENSTWLTKSEAAAALGCHEKTIERHVQKGRLRQGWRPQTGGRRSLAIYNPDDITALKTEKAAGDILPPDVPQPVKAVERAQAVAVVRHREAAPDALQAILEAARATVGPQDKHYLTLDEAVLLSGLPRVFLEGLITAGKLKAHIVGKHGAGFKRRIKRADLETLEL